LSFKNGVGFAASTLTLFRIHKTLPQGRGLWLSMLSLLLTVLSQYLFSWYDYLFIAIFLLCVLWFFLSRVLRRGVRNEMRKDARQAVKKVVGATAETAATVLGVGVKTAATTGATLTRAAAATAKSATATIGQEMVRTASQIVPIRQIHVFQPRLH